MKRLLILLFFVASCSNSNNQALNKKLETQLNPSSEKLNLELIEKFARLSTECVDKEYPYKPGIVLYQKSDLMEPQKRHPIFYGCYDWHSAAHGHWALVKVLNHFPEISFKNKVIQKLDKHFTLEKFKKEAEYFSSDAATTFERPYGIAWFLRLIEELDKSKDPQLKKWRENAKPLEQELVKKMKLYFETFKYPNRVGTHGNSAFAMAHAWDYSQQVKDKELEAAIKKASVEWFQKDENCPVRIEPSGGDFISPCLSVAHLMAQTLSKDEFKTWFNSFFPTLKKETNQEILFPPYTKNIKDPVAGHLVGLTFQKAWSLESIAKSLPENHKYKDLFIKSQKLHLQAGIEQMFDTGYGGTHWLASFAIHALVKE